MRIKHLVAAAAVSASLAMSAQAAVISGWDFSQYTSGGGVLSLDGNFTNFINTLGANYSNQDQSFNAGPDSSAYGTMYINGQFGSTNINPDPAAADDRFLPTPGSLVSNIGGISPNPFDSLTIQLNQGALEANLASMLSGGAVSVVFSATPTGSLADTWSVSFGARATNGGTIQVQFSTDGTTYATVGTATLTAGDTLYTFALAAGQSAAGYVKLDFSQAGQFLDNIAISANLPVPEPATASVLALGLGGLGYLSRRRKP
jgi:PEP-CTERM motif